MAALAANRVTDYKDTGDVKRNSYLVDTAVHIYQGGLVMVLSTGYLVPAADTANAKVVGFADEEVDTTGVAAGVSSCAVLSNITGRLAATSAVFADLDAPLLYVVDDQTVDETQPGNSVKAGLARSPFISATEVWCHVPALGMHTLGL